MLDEAMNCPPDVEARLPAAVYAAQRGLCVAWLRPTARPCRHVVGALRGLRWA